MRIDAKRFLAPLLLAGLLVLGATLGTMLGTPAAEPAKAAAAAKRVNDFPTQARAEYIFSCMAANESNPVWLEKCSCAIDAIANRISYDQYTEAETILTMQLSPTPNADTFRSASVAKGPVERLYHAMAGAELKCFQ